MKKILLALDCSPSSRQAAHYVAGIASRLPGCEVVLFSVLTGVPYSAEELAAMIAAPPAPPEVHGDLDPQAEVVQARAFLRELAGLFRAEGLPPERLALVLKPERRGIAQDILDEAADRGCDTIAVGRRGLSRVQELIQGSTSSDLMHRAEAVTVWVVA